MKKHNRLLAMLMALAMVLAYMPAMAFAEGEEYTNASDEAVAEEAVDTPAEDASVKNAGAEEAINRAKEALSEAEGEQLSTQKLYQEISDFSFTPAGIKYVDNYMDYGDPLNFDAGDKVIADGITYTFDGDWFYSDEGDYFPYDVAAYPDADLYYYNDGQAFTYTVECYENDEIIATAGGYTGIATSVYKNVWVNGLGYELNDNSETSTAGVWRQMYPLSGNINIASSIVLSDGIARAVTLVDMSVAGAASLTIPATVNKIYLSEVPAGFTIFGAGGSYAQTYAINNGIIFRDPVAEAEAARQGTLTAGLPKVKISKPAAAKKSVTVKWKKLDKKQLKKGVTNIEVWVCPNAGFGAGDTIIKMVGKKKASVKVKGLAKGTYFVKVRAIRNVGGVKYYTAWSNVKKVKVKK